MAKIDKCVTGKGVGNSDSYERKDKHHYAYLCALKETRVPEPGERKRK